MHRREFIQLGSALAAGASLLPMGCKNSKVIPGEMVGASASIGHLLRDGALDGPPVHTEQVEVVIVGGGISGLSAARQLHRNGITNMKLLELEKQVGGNTTSGSNEVSAYPWGAHYVPIANNSLTAYLSFLEECGVITGYNETGLPVYNDYHLCSDPQERLYINGNWQGGLVPGPGLPDVDKADINRFLDQMNLYRQAKGGDGRDAFAIPVDCSSKEDTYTALDKLTMKQWMKQEGYKSEYLYWYVNYCTRDDFGTVVDEISAWAGIHYFASRKGLAANAVNSDVLTWPAGNGWLASHLSRNIKHSIHSSALVVKVVPVKDGVTVHYYDVAMKQLKAVIAKQCILAVPQFVAARLLPGAAERVRLVHSCYRYTPWMVANITVGELDERAGAPLSWDNVIYNSASLGYADATHQDVRLLKPRRVLTYYYPLTEGETTEARKKAQQRTHAQWVGMIMDDLKVVHPDIENKVERIDVMIWGHAMAQPLPDMIHGGVREVLQQSINEVIHFAHSDLAGISIFEEAFYQGIHAADKIIKDRKKD